jgi:small subunit ribosomal protein S16
MVKIRLRRTGAKKQPSYRVVIADARAPRDGRFIEIVGHYNPRTDPSTFNIQEDRVLYWLSVGAQPTDTVQYLLKKAGTLERFASLKQGGDLDTLLTEAKASQERQSKASEPRAEAKPAAAAATPSGTEDVETESAVAEVATPEPTDSESPAEVTDSQE